MPNPDLYLSKSKILLIALFSLCAIIFLSPTNTLQAQNPAGIEDAFFVDVPPCALGLGEIGTVEITLLLALVGTNVQEATFTIACDTSKIKIVGASPGPALEAFVDAYGEPVDCDFVIYPSANAVDVSVYFDSINQNGIFIPPFLPGEFGGHFMNLDLEVISQVPAATGLEFRSDFTSPNFHTAPLTLVNTRNFRRGDLNSDATHNLTDAAMLLSILFDGVPTDCADAVDVNDDAVLNILDALDLLNGIFNTPHVLSTSCNADLQADSFPPCLNSCP